MSRAAAAPIRRMLFVGAMIGMCAPGHGQDGSEYRIEAGDCLQIAITGLAGAPDMDPEVEAEVGPDGRFAVHHVGTVVAAGKTRAELAGEIQAALRGRFPLATVTVNVTRYHARDVYVLGEVRQQGAIPVAVSQISVAEAVARAGGLGDAAAAATCVARVLRAGQPVETVDVKALLRGEGAAVPLQPGDSVVVEVRQFTIAGHVVSPRTVPLTDGARLTDALTWCGGTTVDGDVRHAILIDNQNRAVVVDLVEVLNAPETPLNLSIGDYTALIVPSQRRIVIVGEVAKPGSYSVSRQARLSELVAEAGGPTDFANPEACVVVSHDETTRQVDLVAALAAPGTDADLSLAEVASVVVPRRENRVALLGEVNDPGTVEAPVGTLLPVLLAEAGGPTDDADLGAVAIWRADGTREVVDLSELAATGENGDLSDAPIVEPGSVVVVPRRRARVIVLGAVGKPGSHPFEPGDTVIEALAAAGGPKEKANLRKIGLLRRAGERVEVYEVDLQAGLQGSDALGTVPLEHNDIVYVPTRKQPVWASISAVLLGVATVYQVFTR